MRIDNTRMQSVVKSNINMETAGNLSLESEKKTIKDVNYSNIKSVGIKQTTIEKGIKSLEAELDKITSNIQDEEINQLKEKMSVLSNTLSNDNCKSLEDEEWSLNDTDVDTIVTVVEKIKTVLIKAGIDTSGFLESMSDEKIKAMGYGASETLQIEQALKKADLPYTNENKEDFIQALEQAKTLEKCDKGTIKYMVGNKLEPTIANFYKAQHCGSQMKEGQAKELDSNIKKQIEQMLSSGNLKINETTMGYGSFLIENDMPVTSENLKYMDALTNIEFPIDKAELLDSMAMAVIEGRRPDDAVLIKEYTLSYRAEDAKKVIEQSEDEQIDYLVKNNLPLTIENLKFAKETDVQPSKNDQNSKNQEISFVKARRQLEEIRLTMTIEANYKLLRQGISIETKPMEELIEELKGVEEQYYNSLLTQNKLEPTTENISVLKDSIEKTEVIKQVPAYTLGVSKEKHTINTLHEDGLKLKSSMEKAGQAYETLMTAPRKDLGDSISKAFQNVDDILEDLNLEITKANQRAVRILGYNNLEITKESVLNMKSEDQKVQLLFDNLTPPVVMELMKKGINPLHMDISELNAQAEIIKSELNVNEEEKFSKYLWKLEQKNDISKEERDTFIGMYRMLHQVEKSDGAVIGALVNQGANITIENLLTAVRNKKASNMDFTLDDNYESKSGWKRSEPSIMEQIETAYQTDCAKEAFHLITPRGMERVTKEDGWEELTPEQLLWNLKEEQDGIEYEEQYLSRQMEEFALSKDAEKSVLRMLSEFDMPVNTYNIIAGNKMMNKRSQVFSQLFNKESLGEEVNFKEIKEKILADFAEAVKTPEDMARAQEALADTAENVMKKMLETEEVSSIDIRNMKVLRQEIAISKKMSKEENYAIPIVVSGETTNVQLKIVRGTKEKGKIDILFETDMLGKVSSEIKIERDKVTAIIASNLQEGLSILKENEEQLKETLSLDGISEVQLSYVHSKTLDLQYLSSNKDDLTITEEQKQEDEYKVQTKVLYGMSKSFLSMLKGISY